MNRPTTVADLHAELGTALSGGARAWLDQALDESAATGGSGEAVGSGGSVGSGEVGEASGFGGASQHGKQPPVWELRFAEAGRRIGQDRADTARVLLLHTARADAATLTRLYAQGTAAERRAVLIALPHLVPGPEGLPLVEDALRTNDTRLVAAAVGPYAAEHLPAHHWRHAILKCLFTGVPVDAVASLAHRARADAELARMLGDFAAERTAAGRPVPDDLHRVLALTSPAPPTAKES
ncbi:EboA domain-containing protein [Streptomyces sp. VRA16 Mangrove soil]|uniref:EboA domain-containing protein n=1 Tax=Streptomyces sp. VRA16 Mangrove soil TaxID=2817434 RepID=UPI001A9E50A3|nr:EboA domain-containing protein [Streptomyces sp. VRA16 Mangrove soil]MBO1331017.1 EboA domain-containing protein [Streptomyces sp. VRA16 Mangrove soil]